MEEEVRPLYAVLGVAADASHDAIKKAYRRLALEHHPDRKHSQGDFGKDGDESFARVAFAYEVLGNEQRRKRYDLSGEVPQNDAALGRQAKETFLAEYVKAAPKVARGVTDADMSLHSLANYEVLEVDGRDVPEYMRGIVMQGLSYLVAVVRDMEDKEVVLLRHFVMDQMYALMAYSAPLDEGAFAERGYIITYYDHPLQAGIKSSWSDQNGMEHRKEGGMAPEVSQLRNIDPATVERRRLVALEWRSPQGGTGLATVASGQAASASPTVPGEGFSPERLRLGMQALLREDPDLESHTIHHIRRELERLLRLAPHELDCVGATMLMGILYEEAEDVDEESHNDSAVGGAIDANAAPAAPSPFLPAAQELGGGGEGGGGEGGLKPLVGSSVRVRPSGRVGDVLIYDPSDRDMTYKVRFGDGSPDDWFAGTDVEPA